MPDPQSKERDDFVWSSLNVFDVKNEKVATTLSAVFSLLKNSEVQNEIEDELVTLYDHLHLLNSQTYTELVRSPEIYCWLRKAHDAIPCQSNSGVLSVVAVAHLLGEFQEIILGACIAEKCPIEFKTPLSLTLPAAVPCTNLLVTGPEAIKILQYRKSELLVDAGGCSHWIPVSDDIHEMSDQVNVIKQPVASLGGHEIVLSPFVFQKSRIESRDRHNALQFGLNNYARVQPVVQRAIDSIKKYLPDVYFQMQNVMSCIGLNDPEYSGRSQSSLSDLPGTFVAPCYKNEHLIADSFIHEYFHNRLFALEEYDTVFLTEEDENSESVLQIFSPWRVANRPIKGLLHSAYVFVPVTQFWQALYKDWDKTDIFYSYILDECVRQFWHFKIGMFMINKYGEFSPHGQVIMDSLNARVEEIFLNHAELGIPDDTTAMEITPDNRVVPLKWQNHEGTISVRENIRSNIRENDSRGYCQDLPFKI